MVQSIEVAVTTKRPGPAGWSVWALALWFLVQACYALFWTVGYGDSMALEWTGNIGVSMAVLLWFYSDRRQHFEVSDSYRGLGLLVFLPVLIPIYIVQTRGWRRALVILLIGLGFTILGNLIGRAAGQYYVRLHG